MAITKTYINGSLTALKTVLEDTGFFTEVTLNNDTLSCMDGENLVVSISSSTVSIYADATNSISNSSIGTIANCYRTSKGIFITTSNDFPIIIAKTNNNKIGGAMRRKETSTTDLWDYKVCAWGDEAPLTQTFNFMENADTVTPQQTVFCPMPTHNRYGETSVLDGVYATPWNEYRYMGVFTDRATGKEYVSNGYVALMDE